MSENRFVYGQLVAFCAQNSDGLILKIELGVFKHYSSDGKAAFVWYHNGDTAARTPLEYLQPIDNDWYFNEDAKRLGGERSD